LGEVCEIVAGVGIPEKIQGQTDLSVPIFKVGDISRAWQRKQIQLLTSMNTLSDEAAFDLSKRLIPSGATLFAKIGAAIALNRRAIAGCPCIVDNNVMALLPRPGISSLYIFYLMTTIHLDQFARATTVPSIRKDDVSGIEVPIPPFLEQERLSSELDSYLTRLDAAEQALLRAQANLKRYRASVLKSAVEGRLVPTEAELARQEGREYEPASALLAGILAERKFRWEKTERAKMKAKGIVPKDNRWKAKYEEPVGPDLSGLPDLPEGWCWATVDQVAEVGTGATPRRGENRYYEGGTIPWVTSAAVNERFVHETAEFVTPAALKETNLSVYPSGTLILAMYGEGRTRGKVAELTIAATTNQALAALVLPGSAKAVQPWVSLFLEHNYEAIRRLSSGGVQPNLNLGIVRSLQFPLPPLMTQGAIVKEVEEALSETESTLASIAGSLARIARLRQSILKWAFEGRLVDQDPNDEPAAELLARIRAAREKPGARKDKPRRAPRQPLSATKSRTR